MKSVIVWLGVLAVCSSVAFAGEATEVAPAKAPAKAAAKAAEEAPEKAPTKPVRPAEAVSVRPPMPMQMSYGGRSECSALQVAMSLLTLEAQEMQETNALVEGYNQDYAQEMKKVKIALEEKYTAEVKAGLDADKQKQLEELLAVEKAYTDALIEGDDEFRATLQGLFYPNPKDDNEKARNEMMLRHLPADQNQLVNRFIDSTPGLRAKLREPLLKFQTSQSQIYKQERDYTNPASIAEREKELKEANAALAAEMLAALGAEEKGVFQQALDAQAKWLEAQAAGEAAYIKAAETIAGANKRPIIQSRQRQLLYMRAR